MTIKTMAAVIWAAVLTAAAGTASATLTDGSWLMDQSNTFEDQIEYGAVYIQADSDTGDVRFEVIAAVPDFYGELNKFGIQRFGFNFENVTSNPGEWNVSLPAHWSQDNTVERLSAFGGFSVTEGTHGANHRANPLVFTITLPNPEEAIASNFAVPSTGTAGEGNQFFAAHVAGFIDGEASHWISGSAPHLPEPGTLALLALGAVAALVRRK